MNHSGNNGPWPLSFWRMRLTDWQEFTWWKVTLVGIRNWKQAFLCLLIEGGWSWASHFPMAQSPTGPGSAEGQPGSFQERVAVGLRGLDTRLGCVTCNPWERGQTARLLAPPSVPTGLVLRGKEVGKNMNIPKDSDHSEHHFSAFC